MEDAFRAAVLTVVKSPRDSLLKLAVSGLPACEHSVKFHDAIGGQETCGRKATKTGVKRASLFVQIMCDEHARYDADATRDGWTDLPWAEAVRLTEPPPFDSEPDIQAMLRSMCACCGHSLNMHGEDGKSPCIVGTDPRGKRDRCACSAFHEHDESIKTPWGIWYTLTPEAALRSRKGRREGWYYSHSVLTRESAEELAATLRARFPDNRYEVREMPTNRGAS